MDQDASGWKTLLTRANQVVRSATHPAAQLPVEGMMPSLDGATGWLNSPPLTAAGLRGHVVLVQFWTYTCINWLRTLPYVRAWADRYQGHGLVVIGVHTPEFDFEHDLDNVRQQVKDLGVDYPVATDNDYAIWEAFTNHYWPALYFVDAQGQIRHHRFGEGDYEMSEMILQQLLTEAGSGGTDQELTSVDARGVEAAADWDSLRSPENYLGYERTDNFVSPNGSILDTSYAYAAPTRLGPNHWALSGDWTVQRQAIVLNQAGGRILYRFHARDLHLVMAPTTPGVPSGSRCGSTSNPRAPPTAPTSTTRATAPSPNRGCTSSSASPAPSASAPSRSPSWILASTPTPSPSASPTFGTTLMQGIIRLSQAWRAPRRWSEPALAASLLASLLAVSRGGVVMSNSRNAGAAQAAARSTVWGSSGPWCTSGSRPTGSGSTCWRCSRACSGRHSWSMRSSRHSAAAGERPVLHRTASALGGARRQEGRRYRSAPADPPDDPRRARHRRQPRHRPGTGQPAGAAGRHRRAHRPRPRQGRTGRRRSARPPTRPGQEAGCHRPGHDPGEGVHRVTGSPNRRPTAIASRSSVSRTSASGSTQVGRLPRAG